MLTRHAAHACYVFTMYQPPIHDCGFNDGERGHIMLLATVQVWHGVVVFVLAAISYVDDVVDQRYPIICGINSHAD